LNDWTDACGVDELVERRSSRVAVVGEAIMLVKVGDAVYAIGNQCTHQGASLDKGVVRLAGSVKTVTCPAHGSMFRLEDGKVMRPPATKPVPVYDVKIEDGRVWVRSGEPN
jgi:nitrite reductase/ring-hydroxylating ferredoxin subunit